VARYRIVPERSKVFISARSSLHPIDTRTDGLEGFVDLEVQGGGRLHLTEPTKGRVSFPVERLSSGNPLEDRELRRRIDARRFPTIEGELTDIHETGRDGRYLVRGDVTFKGSTRTYQEEMAVSQDDDGTLRLTGESTFDIRDFGMDPPRILMLKVEPEVGVRVEILAEREG
jgi:polyisoprenoid-binding protein YceI